MAPLTTNTFHYTQRYTRTSAALSFPFVILDFFSQCGEQQFTSMCLRLSQHRQLSVSFQTGNTDPKQVAFFAALN